MESGGATATAVSASEESANGGGAAAQSAATTHNHPSTAASVSLQSASWKDLAAFCFGPDWDREPVDSYYWSSSSSGMMMMNGGDDHEAHFNLTPSVSSVRVQKIQGNKLAQS